MVRTILTLNHFRSNRVGSININSDDEDDVAAPMSPVVRGPRTRKAGISAESTDPESLRQQIATIPIIEKSPEVTETLLTCVGKSPLLKTLDPAQKEFIVKAFNGPIIVEAGVDIITQGDIGDVFYLLEDGEVDVYVKKISTGIDPVRVHTYKPGDAFGELALMYNAPRAATCRAKTKVKLWSLDRIAFKCIVVAASLQKRELFRSFLVTVPILSTLTEVEILTLSDSLAEESYPHGSLVCRQGDPGDYFYIIKEGNAICTIENATGQNNIVASLSTGNYFGEVALLTTKTRQATVRTEGTLKVLAVDRATFTRVLGSLEDMEEYKKFAALNI